ncbi:glycosyl hydrolase [Dysgonomonas sp. 216]|uniref:glycoside hydrolase family 3 N-terminal domain-containing protein n=1 Tax=Dysgonomonas sp. 216 TaxID=2302934 RepID=UPI0013D07C76|nr:glycoside hydrolase family 3 N-terminal domain-containing protein [Dysgonomonas sp. 216]NDW18350.1 glycosyl hydrolase [Dysgonomonas sp. 216]NDW18718.1 glycosyl hydrolase [Dysgonomonas sp. 216]
MREIKLLIVLCLSGLFLFSADAQNKKDLPLYKNKSASVEERVEDLLKRMTLKEKIRQLQNRSTSDINNIEGTYNGESFGSAHEMSMSAQDAANLFKKMNEYMATKTRLGIPILTSAEGIHGILQNGCTIFPQAIAQGSTFNPDLIRQMTEAEAKEARAIGIRQVLSPVLDITRELRWGRVEETFGEDPYLISEMAIGFVRGFQENGVGCMPKHFVAHGTPTGGLNAASVPGGERELRSLYTYPFARVIKEANPVAIMSCYSAYDGVPVTGSSYYMTDLLRGELGFKGFVYSDWGSVDRLKTFHFAVSTSHEAAKQALMAGIDMDVWDWAYDTLEEQVKNGQLDESYVDRAARRVLTSKFELGLFDAPYGSSENLSKVIRNKDHVKLAKLVADESAVLLENKNNILPLDMSKYKSIAVIGPNSDHGIAGDYAWVTPEDKECVSLYEGLKNVLGKKATINQIDGCDWWSQDESGIADAVKVVEKSDLAVIAVGTRSYWLGREAKSHKVTSGEGFDISSLDLPGKQLDLIKAAKATGKPIIVVLITGKPLVLSWVKENADAVLVQFYGGEQQGNSMADILAGNVNPSGKLNVSFPRSTGNTPCYYNYYPTDREQIFDKGGSLDEPNGHYIFEKPYALYNFGYGLSYTNFKYVDCTLNDSVFTDNGTIKVTVEVENTGNMDGKEVIQLYVRDMISSVSTPIQQLKAFKKELIKSGERTKIQLEVPVSELALYNTKMQKVVEPGEFEIQIGGSSDNIAFRKTIVVK